MTVLYTYDGKKQVLLKGATPAEVLRDARSKCRGSHGDIYFDGELIWKKGKWQTSTRAYRNAFGR
jgi:hypothetical protein